MNREDRNFDDISHKFSRNIYGTTKGMIRESLVWESLNQILNHYPKNQPLTILDAGGGQGQLAIKLAKQGHHVTICDISKQMLTIASQHAEIEKLSLRYLHCSIQQLDALIEDQQFDIVICHAVLEWVADPLLVLTSLKKHLKPNGHFSLMFYNFHGLLFKTVTLGNFGYIKSGLTKRKKKTLSPDYPRMPDEIYHWLNQLGFTITKKIGIRIFHDYLIDKSKQKTKFEALLELEKQYCNTEAYINIARYILITAMNAR